MHGDTLRLTCTGFVWAGGQEKAPGSLVATFRRNGSTIEWDTVVEMERPVKTVTTIIRDVPRGKISLGGGAPFDAHDNETLGGYTFGAGDLHGPGASVGITTALAAVQAGEQDFFYLSSLDDRVRPKRFYFQPGERAYRVEAVYEHDAWRNDTRLTVPRWRVGRAPSLDDAVAPHMAHVERAFGLQPWETRTDVPAMAATDRAGNDAPRHALHGLHVQRLRAHAGDPALDGDADPARARARVHLGLGWPVLLGLPELRRARPHGWRGRVQAPDQRGQEARLQDDADVRRELREPEAARVAQDRVAA